MKFSILILVTFICGAKAITNEFGNDPCVLMAKSLRVIISTFNRTECIQAGYCWVVDSTWENGGYCFTAKGSLDCDIPLSEQVNCGPTTEKECLLYGCCWNPPTSVPITDAITDAKHTKRAAIIKEIRCYRREVKNPCDEIVNKTDCANKEGVLTPTKDPDICVNKYGCCWDRNGQWCFQELGCGDLPDRFGPCSKTCGVGVWQHFDGCGRFLGQEECCERPCKYPIGLTTQRPSTQDTGTGTRKPCKGYPPYGMYRQGG